MYYEYKKRKLVEKVFHIWANNQLRYFSREAQQFLVSKGRVEVDFCEDKEYTFRDVGVTFLETAETDEELVYFWTDELDEIFADLFTNKKVQRKAHEVATAWNDISAFYKELDISAIHKELGA